MAADNSLGTFDFICLEDVPDLVKQQLEEIRRPGVNGVGFWKEGFTGQSFELTSKVDVQNMQYGITTLQLYQTYIGADPQTLVYGGVNLETVAGIKFMVTNVRPVRLLAIKSAVGRQIHPPSEAWLEARWTLVPVTASTS